jgi:hypothetical protein
MLAKEYEMHGDIAVDENSVQTIRSTACTLDLQDWLVS